MSSPPFADPLAAAVGTALPLHLLLAHAADAVAAVRAGRSLTDALSKTPAPARPGAQALASDAMRCLGLVQAVRDRLVPKPSPLWADALVLVALSLLLLPVADADRIGYADHTVVDQAVRAAKQRAAPQAAFVNAVLRRCLRERDSLVAAVRADPVARWNHPRWWIAQCTQDWPDDWQGILAAAADRPPMALRVNARRGTADGYVERLIAAGHPAQRVRWRGALCPQAIVLQRPVPVQALPGFAAGDVSVQDVAAQLAAPLLVGDGLPPGSRVLDACAAPGGKAAHLLELADAEVIALDVDAQRLAKVAQTLARLQLTAEVRAGDASNPAAWWDGRPFDAILLDAPCSASGIVRRHPDARWLRRAADIAALVRLQAALLDALWPLLRPGGRFVYVTCSVFRSEGVEQIDAFLQRTGDARLRPSPGHLLPVADNEGQPQDGAPLAAVTDGFFYAVLDKSAA